LEQLVAGGVLVVAGPGTGLFSWRPVAHAAHGGGGGKSRSVAGQRGVAAMAFGQRPRCGGAARVALSVELVRTAASVRS
jgi:hypothetical protein